MLAVSLVQMLLSRAATARARAQNIRCSNHDDIGGVDIFLLRCIPLIACPDLQPHAGGKRPVADSSGIDAAVVEGQLREAL